MKTKTKLKLTTIIALLTLTIVQTTNALGLVTITVDNPDPITGNYSWFVYEKDKGDTIKDSATIKNLDTIPLTVNIYAVDATSNKAGSFVLKLPKEKQTTIGKWTKLNTTQLTLKPQQSIKIPFTIKIPTNITPGQYQGGIIVETKAKNTKKEQQNNNTRTGIVSINTRIGTRIYLTVRGKIHNDITLQSFTAKKQLNGTTKFNFKIQNKGNITIEPKAHIEIYDSFGNPYETIDETLGTSMPNTTITPSIAMKKHPLIGSYKAKLTMSYKAKFTPSNIHESPEIETKEITFWVMPWEIITTILLLLLIIATYITIKIKKEKTYKKNSEEYKVKKHDNLIQIAKDRNTSWKQIAKYNKLKPPYILKEGTILLIPKKK